MKDGDRSVRQRSDLPQLRVLVILLGIVLLSLHWSIREDPCAAGNPLEIQVANARAGAADVLVEVADSDGSPVFRHTYHLEPGQVVGTGPILVAPGAYQATASVVGDGSVSEFLRADGCGGTARIEITEGTVTIVRSEEP